MWVSVTVNNFIVLVLHLQIGFNHDDLINLIDLIDSDVEKLSTGEEVACYTLVTLNKVIEKGNNNTNYEISMIVLCFNIKLCS